MSIMKLSKSAILALKGLDKPAKLRLGKAAGVSLFTIYRWINANHDNLTKAAILPVISAETGLLESEILVAETEKVESN